MKKARYFYGEETHNTWPKLFVLTDDGVFFCSFLNYMKPDSVRLSFEFNTFKSSDYTWGGYQSIEEITYNQAINKTLRNQDNWIADYVILNNIDKNYKSFGSFTDNNIGIDESEHYYDSREEQRENERNADFYLNEGDPNWEANRDQEDFDRAFYGDDD